MGPFGNGFGDLGTLTSIQLTMSGMFSLRVAYDGRARRAFFAWKDSFSVASHTVDYTPFIKNQLASPNDFYDLMWYTIGDVTPHILGGTKSSKSTEWTVLYRVSRVLCAGSCEGSTDMVQLKHYFHGAPVNAK